ncbi:amidase [Sinorhizobium meliloti]|nr:amidase [Sinorhizobium meliloti]
MPTQIGGGLMNQTAIEIAESVRRRQISATEVVRHAIERIKAVDATLNAFVEIDEDGAHTSAMLIDQKVACGEDPGPLAGVPIGVKDLEDCAGLRTCYGSAFYRDSKTKLMDSVHVARLRGAGAVPLGKTATAEFGMDNMTASRAFGVTRNPWNRERTPSGSSGGSAAAVAAGMVPLATGSDGGGSIRVPAAWTGLVGLKPSHGRIPLERESVFTALGALTTSVLDTARYLDVAAGHHPIDRMSLPSPTQSYEKVAETLDVSDLRVGWSDDFGYGVMDPEVVEIAYAAAEALISTARLEKCRLELSLETVRPFWRGLMGSRAWSELTREGYLPDRISEISDVPQRSLVSGAKLTIEDVYEIERRLSKLRRDFAAAFQDVDVLVSPTAATEAFAAAGPAPDVIDGRDASNTGPAPLGFIANTCWNPAISVPAGFTRSGLPVGLMITVPHHRDDIALRLARLFELARPWPLTAPIGKID